MQHTVFLRSGCILPGQLDPLLCPVNRSWERVDELEAQVFDTMIRQAGWHSMWIQEACVRRGIGRSRASATSSALSRALNAIGQRFNSAELDSIESTSYCGIRMARVTVQPRQIQPQISLDCPCDI